MSTATLRVDNKQLKLKTFEVNFNDASQEVLVPANANGVSHTLKSIYIQATGTGAIEFYNSADTSVPNVKIQLVAGAETALVNGEFPFIAGQIITVKSSTATPLGTAWIVLEERI